MIKLRDMSWIEQALDLRPAISDDGGINFNNEYFIFDLSHGIDTSEQRKSMLKATFYDNKQYTYAYHGEVFLPEWINPDPGAIVIWQWHGNECDPEHLVTLSISVNEFLLRVGETVDNIVWRSPLVKDDWISFDFEVNFHPENTEKIKLWLNGDQQSIDPLPVEIGACSFEWWYGIYKTRNEGQHFDHIQLMWKNCTRKRL